MGCAPYGHQTKWWLHGIIFPLLLTFFGVRGLIICSLESHDSPIYASAAGFFWDASGFQIEKNHLMLRPGSWAFQKELSFRCPRMPDDSDWVIWAKQLEMFMENIRRSKDQQYMSMYQQFFGDAGYISIDWPWKRVVGQDGCFEIPSIPSAFFLGWWAAEMEAFELVSSKRLHLGLNTFSDGL